MNLDLVIKVGGSLLADRGGLAAALRTIVRMAQERRVLIVPGGGPFADAVREVDRRLGLSDDAAHWLAVAAMDQYAHVLMEFMQSGVLITHPRDLAALDRGRVPVLAPSQWLRESDPLPHSWDVTSDSIAAWVAGEVGARQLMLIKPAGATGALVDAYFARALPASVTPLIVTAERLDQIEADVIPTVRVKP